MGVESIQSRSGNGGVSKRNVSLGLVREPSMTRDSLTNAAHRSIFDLHPSKTAPVHWLDKTDITTAASLF